MLAKNARQDAQLFEARVAALAQVEQPERNILDEDGDCGADGVHVVVRELRRFAAAAATLRRAGMVLK
eukprot:5281906-Prymnesium_polylepis.1